MGGGNGGGSSTASLNPNPQNQNADQTDNGNKNVNALNGRKIPLPTNFYQELIDDSLQSRIIVRHHGYSYATSGDDQEYIVGGSTRTEYQVDHIDRPNYDFNDKWRNLRTLGSYSDVFPLYGSEANLRSVIRKEYFNSGSNPNSSPAFADFTFTQKESSGDWLLSLPSGTHSYGGSTYCQSSCLGQIQNYGFPVDSRNLVLLFPLGERTENEQSGIYDRTLEHGYVEATANFDAMTGTMTGTIPGKGNTILESSIVSALHYGGYDFLNQDITLSSEITINSTDGSYSGRGKITSVRIGEPATEENDWVTEYIAEGEVPAVVYGSFHGIGASGMSGVYVSEESPVNIIGSFVANRTSN